jgi:hypothetical protein
MICSTMLRGPIHSKGASIREFDGPFASASKPICENIFGYCVARGGLQDGAGAFVLGSLLAAGSWTSCGNATAIFRPFRRWADSGAWHVILEARNSPKR